MCLSFTLIFLFDYLHKSRAMGKLQKSIIGILFLIAAAIGIIYFLTSTENKTDALSLEHIRTFPESDNYALLGKPVSYAFSEEMIYVSDQDASQIHVFDYKGNLIRQIGRKGSGPGEFLILGEIAYSDNHLFVNDFGNGRLAEINLESNETEYVFPQPQPNKFIVYNHKIYMTHLVRGDQDINQLPLIWKYDLDMNLERKFGDFLTDQVEGMTGGASELNMKVFNDRLYVLFQYYPLLRIYSLEGKLIDTINLNQYYGDKAEPNYAPDTFADPSYLDLESLFGGFDVTDEGIFIYPYNEQYIIDFFNHEGERLNRFKRDNSYWLMDMKVVRRPRGNIDFVLGSFTPPEVNILRWNRNE